MSRHLSIAAAVVIVLAVVPAARAQDALEPARALYASAAYEEALGALDRLRTGSSLSAGDLREADQYRVLCLLALGRQDEAERAIESIVTADPFFAPGEAAASPRVRAAFQSVRQRLLPTIVQQKYAMAKATHDRKEYAAAAEQFKRVIALLDDPGLSAGTPALSDLKTLATGFLDLAVAAATPPPPPKPAEPVLPPPPVMKAPAIYEGTEPGVTAPVVERQDLPKWPSMHGPTPAGQKGVLELVINENGRVEAAMIRQSVDARYDPMLLDAAQHWRYRPATVAGVPVKFRKRIQVVLQR